MSITRFIEIWKKDQRENTCSNGRWVSWKNLGFDMWISMYLNDCVDQSVLRQIPSDGACVKEVPKEVFMDMAERLLSRRYDLGLNEDEQSDLELLDEVRPWYIESFAECLKQLVLETGEDEMMVYINYLD